jgi:hypothetical protein
MTLVVVAVAVIGAMSCVNLLLTYGVIRRLRQQDTTASQPGLPALPNVQPAVGQSLPAFAAMSVDGTDVTGETVSTGPAAIGFFSTSCPPCREELPQFLTAVGYLDRRRIIVVVNDDNADGTVLDAFRARADGVCELVVEPTLGPVASTFKVSVFPTMLFVYDGLVVANEQNARALPIPGVRDTDRRLATGAAVSWLTHAYQSRVSSVGGAHG